MSTQTTIVAQCTPTGSGALALIRVSGHDALTIVARCAHFSSKQSLLTAASHTIHHGWVVGSSSKKKIDEVLFLVMHAPKTFTGEHTVEITCHNNQFLIQEIIQEIILCGARLAQPGEFTRCAVENNKIDLLQAESINEVIHANNQQALKAAFLQVEGSLSQWIAKIEKKIMHCIVLIEASFEFLEEDVDFSKNIKHELHDVLQIISSLKVTFDQQKLIRQGIRIALLGSVNAGKSSLFNHLVAAERAIVTSIAGTTRDVIESGVYRSDGTYVTFIDTAGLRHTNNVIERAGITRSFKEAELADIILLVVDGSRTHTKAEETIYQQLIDQYLKKIILIVTKHDIARDQTLCLTENVSSVALSTHTKYGCELLEERITERIQALLKKTDSPFLLTQRQKHLLLHFEQELLAIQAMLINDEKAYELIAHHAKNALADLSELTGRSISEQALDAIFKEFCVGK